MSAYKTVFAMLMYILSLCIITSVAVIGAESAIEPDQAIRNIFITAVINILAVVVLFTIDRGRKSDVV
jgi:hypothetical protein